MSYLPYETMQEVQFRILQAYLIESSNLYNTDVKNLVQNFTSIVNATLDDLDCFRHALDESLLIYNDFRVAMADSINNILVPTENSYLMQRVGHVNLTTSARQESFDDGLTYVTTITSLIGPHSISNVSLSDDDSLTGVLGNQRLEAPVLLGFTYDTPSSITDAISKLITAAELAIGRDNLNVANSIILNQCSLEPNILGDEIYTTSSQVSAVEAFNGISACAAWVAQSETYGITNTGDADDCYIFTVDKALSGCIYYLSGQQM